MLNIHAMLIEVEFQMLKLRNVAECRSLSSPICDMWLSRPCHNEDVGISATFSDLSQLYIIRGYKLLYFTPWPMCGFP